MYFTSALNRGCQLYAPAILAINSPLYTLNIELVVSHGKSGRIQKKTEIFRRSSFPWFSRYLAELARPRYGYMVKEKMKSC